MQAAAAAPGEIRADAATVAGAHRRVLNALQQAGFDSTKVPPEVANELKVEPFVGAKARLGSYSTSSC